MNESNIFKNYHIFNDHGNYVTSYDSVDEVISYFKFQKDFGNNKINGFKVADMKSKLIQSINELVDY